MKHSSINHSINLIRGETVQVQHLQQGLRPVRQPGPAHDQAQRGAALQM